MGCFRPPAVPRRYVAAAADRARIAGAGELELARRVLTDVLAVAPLTIPGITGTGTGGRPNGRLRGAGVSRTSGQHQAWQSLTGPFRPAARSDDDLAGSAG